MKGKTNSEVSVSQTFTATIPSSGWTQPSGGEYYFAKVDIANLPTDGTATWDIAFTAELTVPNVNSYMAQVEEWGKVFHILRTAGRATFFATEALAVDVNVMAEVIFK